jgi:hypothetical protein
LTLVELMIAMSIMVMVVGALGALAKAVQEGFEYTESHGTATQHGRLALDRITRAVHGAAANELFPGIYVVPRQLSAWRFPDTLVVWHPDGELVDAQGLPRLPRYDELVIYCPGPETPDRLVEITTEAGGTLSESEADWASEIEAIKTSPASDCVTLTNLVRTSAVLDSGTNAYLHLAAVRFHRQLRPSKEDFVDYQDAASADPSAAEAAWKSLPWMQGICGPTFGLRQVCLRMELQLVPGQGSSAADSAGQRAIPFLGSAGVYYVVQRK